MSILSGAAILQMIKGGKLRIEPFEAGQVGAGSVDLHLGSEFRRFKKGRKVFEVDDEADFRMVTESVRVEPGDALTVRSGELVHGITLEKVTLPPDLAAFIEGRSSLARVGLLTHLSSGFIHPGTSNRTVLEIVNVSPIPIAIRPGTRICQLIFVRVEGSATYTGRFSEQLEP